MQHEKAEEKIQYQHIKIVLWETIKKNSEELQSNFKEHMTNFENRKI